MDAAHLHRRRAAVAKLIDRLPDVPVSERRQMRKALADSPHTRQLEQARKDAGIAKAQRWATRVLRLVEALDQLLEGSPWSAVRKRLQIPEAERRKVATMALGRWTRGEGGDQILKVFFALQKSGES